jgi:hypothetical protein
MPLSSSKKKQQAEDPTNFEDMLDFAIELEEKGDRYKSGDKAKRFYERSNHWYTQANNLRPDLPELLYNW